jgi:hypothetical protein
MDGAVNAAAPEHLRVGGIDNGICCRPGYIPLNDVDVCLRPHHKPDLLYLFFSSLHRFAV